MNIKIGKGGSGSVNSTKGGSGKTNQKKYIDLLPPNFISKVTISNAGSSQANGIYVRSAGGFTQFTGPNNCSIFSPDDINWTIYDNLMGESLYISSDFINWSRIDGLLNLPAGVTENALSFLFDPIFYKSEIQNGYYKILVQGCSLSYVNGIYSQTVDPSLVNNRPYFIKDDDTNMRIYFDGSLWIIGDQLLRDYGVSDLFRKSSVNLSSSERPDNLDWSTPNGGTPDGGFAYDEGQTPPTITQYSAFYDYGDLDPLYLGQIRDYQINDAVPTLPNKVSCKQDIINASFNTRKALIKNNTFSYIKYSDNSDVEGKKLKRNYLHISSSQTAYGVNPPTDNNCSLLTLSKNNGGYILNNEYNMDQTLNMFIRLQRPVQHKKNGYLVREKRGIFCTSDANGGGFSIGYRSPYYNITGRPSYKGVFNNFSFVFSFGHRGYYGDPFYRPISINLMTDYKFNFGEMYMLSIVYEVGSGFRILINGELQTVAIIPFNPLVNPTAGGQGGSGQIKRLYSTRRDNMPLGPGFYKKDGTVYSPTDVESGAISTTLQMALLRLGTGPLSSGPLNRKKRRRYLNNLDIGVINSYNIALSQAQISEMYNNFKHRYV